MSFPAYPSYRESGVEWLGPVPSHWTVERLGNLYREMSEAGSPELPVLSVSIHTGVSDEEADPDDSERKIVRSEDRSKYKRVAPNDLAYNMMRAWQGGFGAVQVDGMVSPAYVVARPRGDVPSKYIELLLRTPGAVEEMRRYSRGVTDFRLRLYWDQFKDIRIALPPREEREAILAFLDRETAKIDALVAEQRRLVELLKEKRQTVISHAVTSGLNPDAPMKDSGVEWLGEVPAHWEVRPMSSLLQQSPCYGVLVPDSAPGGIPMLRITDMADGTAKRADLVTISVELSAQYQRTIVTEGDLLLSVVGTIGESLIVGRDLAGVNLSRAVARLRPNQDTTSHYLRWVIRGALFGHFVDLTCVGTAQRVLNMGALSTMRIPVPPTDEQATIAEALFAETTKLEALILEANAAADLLQERRAALISAAVTGKIDVRATAAQPAEAA